jgi:hypothetical protein
MDAPAKRIMLKIEDLQFPGDELVIERHSDEEIGISCIEQVDGEAMASVALTFSQARQLADWIMANTES